MDEITNLERHSIEYAENINSQFLNSSLLKPSKLMTILYQIWRTCRSTKLSIFSCIFSKLLLDRNVFVFNNLQQMFRRSKQQVVQVLEVVKSKIQRNKITTVLKK